MSAPSTEVAIDSSVTLSEAIVVAVAEREGMSPLEIPPLFETIDPDALDSLFRERSAGRVSFEYAGYEVVICGRDRLLLHETESGPHCPDCSRESNETAERRFYCDVCGWNVGIDDTTDSATGSHQAIDHFLTTDHSPIERREITE